MNSPLLNIPNEKFIKDYSNIEIRINCPQCGNLWWYSGNKKINASCTDCKKNVLIQKNTTGWRYK